MTRRLLLEIGVEEMPAAAAAAGIDQLVENAARLFSENRLLAPDAARPHVFGTPRRLTLIIDALPTSQRSEVLEIKGPPVARAFDADGGPTAAATGFAKAQGVSVDQLEPRESGGASYLFAVKESHGRPSAEVLPEILPALVRSLEFTKAMRWGTGTFKFIRPVRWFAALFGADIVPFEVDGLSSGRRTFGHRFLAEGPFDIADAADYEAVMKAARVEFDQTTRRSHIESLVLTTTAQSGGRALTDPDDQRVLDEVNFLVEEPHVVIGDFDADFLRVPQAALVTAMKSHQRYFPIEDEAGELLPRFAVVHNGDPAQADTIRSGHQRVLRARLADADFFFSEDTKTSLVSKVENLKTVVWQAKLGTLWQKTERVRALTAELARALNAGPEETALADKAALLAKADLTSSMVIEFTELQGIIGREYALVDGEDPRVADAILEHYLPRHAGDDAPASLIGQIVSLADKLDSLAGCFLVGLIPTGSADPYSLRRQAAGAVRILERTEWSFAILELIGLAVAGYAGAAIEGGQPREASSKLHEFIATRLKRRLLDAGYAAEIIEAVMAAGHDTVADVVMRVSLIDGLKGMKELEDVQLAFTRCRNLARPELGEAVEPDLFEDPSEGSLFESAVAARPRVEEALAGARPAEAVGILASLRPPIDEFFEAVMVMVEDAKVKENRLRLLNICVALSERVADFSKLP